MKVKNERLVVEICADLKTSVWRPLRPFGKKHTVIHYMRIVGMDQFIEMIGIWLQFSYIS